MTIYDFLGVAPDDDAQAVQRVCEALERIRFRADVMTGTESLEAGYRGVDLPTVVDLFCSDGLVSRPKADDLLRYGRQHGKTALLRLYEYMRIIHNKPQRWSKSTR